MAPVQRCDEVYAILACRLSRLIRVGEAATCTVVVALPSMPVAAAVGVSADSNGGHQS